MSEGKWRVYNVHKDGLTHSEKFRGDPVVIKAGDYVLMDYEDAIQFRGQYFPMQMDGDNQQIPASMKMIKLVPDSPDAAPAVKMKFVCQRDGKEFSSAAELEAYTKENFGHEVFKDDALEEKKKSKKTG